jgi:hypothetical protein
MAAAGDLKSSAARHAGSNPASGTRQHIADAGEVVGLAQAGAGTGDDLIDQHCAGEGAFDPPQLAAGAPCGMVPRRRAKARLAAMCYDIFRSE